MREGRRIDPVRAGDPRKPVARPEEALDVARLVQRNAEARECLTAGTEVQGFRVDQHAVVVPEDGLQHGDESPLHDQPRRSRRRPS
jgi:hypothetical protein